MDTTLRRQETTSCDRRYADVAKRRRSRIGQGYRRHGKVEATSSGDALAHLLCCPAGAPLLAVTSVMADGPGDPPFEYRRTLFRADRVYLDVDQAQVMAAGGQAAHSPVPQHPSSGR